tara:strand:+ start:1920 stop:3086 length:1167 start_codon:yes stop_codon:yes gene_type:complete
MLVYMLLVVLFLLKNSKRQQHVNEIHSIADTNAMGNTKIAQRNSYRGKIQSDNDIAEKLGISLKRYIEMIHLSLEPTTTNHIDSFEQELQVMIGYPPDRARLRTRNYQQHFFNALRGLRETGRAPRMNEDLGTFIFVIALDMLEGYDLQWPYLSVNDPISQEQMSLDISICGGAGLHIDLETTSPEDFAHALIDVMFSNGCMTSEAPFVIPPNIVLYRSVAALPKSHANKILLHNMGDYWDAYLIEPNHAETYPGQMQFYDRAFEYYQTMHAMNPTVKQIEYKGMRYPRGGTCSMYSHGGLCQIMVELEILGPLPEFEDMLAQTTKWLKHAYRNGKKVTRQLQGERVKSTVTTNVIANDNNTFFFDSPMKDQDWDLVYNIDGKVRQAD